MIIISAMSENRVIGDGDGMPWDVPAEYQQYLRFVGGNTVILGRKSYEIFGSDLPADTTPIVVSRSAEIDGVRVAASFDAACAAAADVSGTLFVAGGGSIYRLAIPVADQMFLSTIKGQYEGDTYFPEFDPSDWELTETRHEPAFVFRKYRRRR